MSENEATSWISQFSLIVTAFATTIGAVVAWRSFRRMRNKEKPVLDFNMKGFDTADNVLAGKLTIRNPGPTKIVVRRIRLLKPRFSERKTPRVGLSSAEVLEKTLLPQRMLEEPLEIEPGQEGNKRLYLYLILRSGRSLGVKFGVDIEYLGTKIKTETIKIKRSIKMPEPRTEKRS